MSGRATRRSGGAELMAAMAARVAAEMVDATEVGGVELEH